jgi:hypothetical protein
MKKLILTAITVVLCAGAVLYFVTGSHVPSILAIAKPVPAVVKWGSWYTWLNDREVLNVGTRDTNGNRKASQVDIANGTCKPLDGLSRTFSGMHPGSPWSLSPDGKWLLWCGIDPSSRSSRPREVMVASSMDGRHELYRSVFDNAIWLPDSTGWISFLQKQGIAHLHIYHPNRPGFEDRAFPNVIERRAGKGFATVGTLYQSQPLGYIGRSRLLLANTGYVGLFTADASFHELDLDHPERSRQFKITFQDQSRVTSVALSPDGTRLAWLTEELHWPLFPALANRLRFLGIKPHWYEHLWTSRLDGTGSHIIAIQDVYDVPYGQRFGPARLHWTQDGKRLSFLYLEKLYVTPAN